MLVSHRGSSTLIAGIQRVQAGEHACLFFQLGLAIDFDLLPACSTYVESRQHPPAAMVFP